jgi:hypothetical protein
LGLAFYGVLGKKPTLPVESEAKEFRTQYGDKQGEEVESDR